VVAAAAVAFTQIQAGTSLGLLAVAMFVAGPGAGAGLPPAIGAAHQDMPQPGNPPATPPFNLLVPGGSPLGTAALPVILPPPAPACPAPAAACPVRRPCRGPAPASSASSPARPG